jgi:Tfp pilus assembly protein PilE
MDQLTGSAANTTTYNNALRYYSVGIADNTGTGYVITATRKGDLADDPKCGNFTLTMAAGITTKNVSSGDSAYCWRH